MENGAVPGELPLFRKEGVAEATFRIANTAVVAVKKFSCRQTPNFKPLIFSCVMALCVQSLFTVP